jgi:hypothetical protein
MTNQAEQILKALETWCEKNNGRRVIVGRTDTGWRVALDQHVPHRGESLLDALAQAATVAALE